jgi:hypothetical protein
MPDLVYAVSFRVRWAHYSISGKFPLGVLSCGWAEISKQTKMDHTSVKQKIRWSIFAWLTGTSRPLDQTRNNTGWEINRISRPTSFLFFRSCVRLEPSCLGRLICYYTSPQEKHRFIVLFVTLRLKVLYNILSDGRALPPFHHTS